MTKTNIEELSEKFNNSWLGKEALSNQKEGKEMNEIATNDMGNIMERLVLGGDLSSLSPLQKVEYYNHFCNSLGLNAATKPFQIIKFQGKEILYATKDATEQLRKIHGVSIMNLDKLFQNDLYIVTVTAQDKNGRQDVATGVVSIANLKGETLANAIMKAESKAKRRVTLSICGLGMLDDSETDTIGAYKKVDVTTGEVIETKAISSAPSVPEYSKEDILVAATKSIDGCKTEDELKSVYKNIAKEVKDKAILKDIVNLCSIKKSILKPITNEGDILQ
ncbi:MAG: hypothetical protein WC917_02875 [Bacilli bacterium]|jgi:hypothetical protein